MPLTAKSLRSVKFDGKRQKLWDGGGLYLHILKTGSVWRYDYQYKGQKRTTKLGAFPELTLKKARLDRDAIRLVAEKGTDPEPHKAPPSAADEPPTTVIKFREAAVDWEARDGIEWSNSHRKNVTHRLKNYIFPVIGDLALDEIKPAHIREILDSCTAGGHYETARKVRQYTSQIFRAAVIAGDADNDPAQLLTGYVKRKKAPSSYAHTTSPKKIGEILRAVDTYTGSDSVKFALQIAPHVLLRPGELRGARWSELDLKAGRWTIPAERMKRSDNGNHLVLLSKQVVKLFRELETINSRSELCFPGIRDLARPISDNSLAAGLRRLDIPKELQSIHGWRHTGSTMLNESGGFDPDLIELTLHHCNHSMRAKYNKAQHVTARKKMMQVWSNRLDAMKEGKEHSSGWSN